MKYLLDANIIIYLLKGQYLSILTHFEEINFKQIATSSITKAELEYGCQKSENYNESMQFYKKILDMIPIIPFESKDAFSYGKLRAKLKREGKEIGPNNSLIAAIALSNDYVLVTHNTKEFERVEGLKIEDWTI